MLSAAEKALRMAPSTERIGGCRLTIPVRLWAEVGEHARGHEQALSGKWARLFPLIPRNSERYKTLYKLRSGTERSNNLKKGVYALPGCRHRRASFWLIRLHLAALLQHAKAWVAEMDARAFVAALLGEPQEAAA